MGLVLALGLFGQTLRFGSGEGYVPGAVIMDMYSGLAKAYGIYTILSFLHLI